VKLQLRVELPVIYSCLSSTAVIIQLSTHVTSGGREGCSPCAICYNFDWISPRSGLVCVHSVCMVHCGHHKMKNYVIML